MRNGSPHLVPTSIRLPLEVLREVRLVAEEQHRSVSGQIRVWIDEGLERTETDDG